MGHLAMFDIQSNPPYLSACSLLNVSMLTQEQTELFPIRLLVRMVCPAGCDLHAAKKKKTRRLATIKQQCYSLEMRFLLK